MPGSKLALALATAALLAASTLAAADAPPATTAAQQFAELGDFKLESGAVIHDCAIGYRTRGTLDEKRSNAVVFLTWHTGKSADALEVIGAHALLDPKSYFVVVIDAIGNGVSCSPSNSTTQHGIAFPHFTIRDLVRSQHEVLTRTLGLDHVHAIVGFSMGGSQAFQWLVSHPDFMDVAVPIAGTPRQSSYDLLLWRTLEQAILEDPDYAQGRYTKNPQLPLYQWIFALNATSPAYRVAHTAPETFDAYFEKTGHDSDPDAPDANDSRWQIDAMLTQDIGQPGRDGNARSLEAAARKVHARVHVVVAAHDHLVNPLAAQDFAKAIDARVTVLPGDCGHFAPLRCNLDQAADAVANALAGRRRAE